MDDEQVTTDLRKIWDQLESIDQSGVHMLGLHDSMDMNATIRNPDKTLGLHFQLTQEVAFTPSELVGSQQVGIDHTPGTSGSTLTLSLLDPASRDLFLTLCDDIVPRVLSKTTQAAAATVLVRRFARWQQFLRTGGAGGLSAERQQGLYGELKTLQELIIPTVGVARGVESWTGPDRASQDFQLDRMAIEVKTIVQSEPQQFTITNERQLDDYGLDALLVAHHRVLRYQGSGETLPSLVEELRELLQAEEGPSDNFEDRILSYGYADHHRSQYEQSGFALRETSYYKVGPGFPRLTENDLPPGVGSLRYLVDASACGPYTVDTETVTAWFRDPPQVTEPGSQDESHQVEYKETAWTPVGGEEPKNPEHSARLERALKTSVVKTVLAFLNTDGGELVIGVRDSGREVTGIAPDLVSRGRDPEDLDFYERELVTLFSEHIDNRVFNQLRIRFENHETGTTCHIGVRPSPSPRFGTPPAEQNEKRRPRFWVRAGNATKELEGEEILGWIAESWN